MTLGLPARAKRALDALQLNYWMISAAEYMIERPAVRVVYERPTGNEIRLEFNIEPTRDADIEEWIEVELIQRLRAKHAAYCCKVVGHFQC